MLKWLEARAKWKTCEVETTYEPPAILTTMAEITEDSGVKARS